MAPTPSTALDCLAIKALAEQLNSPEFVASILHRQGVVDPASAQDYFFPDDKILNDPCGIRDLRIAVQLLQEALPQQPKIAIHGDYDVDGVTGAALLYLALQQCGFQQIKARLPNRFTTGYGLCEQTVRDLIHEGYTWLITVDTGITANPEVALAKSLGMKVIICDHHQQGTELPQADAIINPNRKDCNYPNKHLSGVAVAWKFARFLLQSMIQQPADHFLDLVALGTLADLMPLLGENRLLVKNGLKLLVQSQRPGLKLLVEESHLDPEYPRAQDILFRITPILNAAGRMGDADLALQFLLAENADTARKLLEKLRDCNKERRMWENMMVREAAEIVEKDLDLLNAPLLVFGSSNWNQGVIGIVAARMIERFHKPVAVLSIDENGDGKASCRSVGGYNWLENLEKNSDLLDRWGGHCHAAGFTLAASKLPELRQRLCSSFECCVGSGSSGSANPEHHILTDFEIKLQDLNVSTMDWLQKLEPFGARNPYPLFYAHHLQLEGLCRIVGGEHLRMSLRQGNAIFDSIAFQKKDLLDWIQINRNHLSIAFYPVWNLRRDHLRKNQIIREIQLQIVGFASSE